MITEIEDVDVEEAAEQSARRQSLKRKLAECAVLAERAEELEAIGRKLDQNSDAAAEKHRASTQPLQDELKALDDEHITNVLADKKTAPKTIARRRAIVEEIQRHNQSLEDVVESNKRAKKALPIQIHDLRIRSNARINLETELKKTAPQSLHDELTINKSRLGSAEGRLRNAEGFVTRNRSLIQESERRGDSHNVAVYGERLRTWELVRADALEERNGYMRNAEEIVVQMLD